MDNLNALGKLIQALAPWRAHLVFIGGWAHRIHRFSPMANELDYQPLFTRDTDLALANGGTPIEGDIRAALIEHGFEERLAGEHNPAVAHYTLGEDDGGFYAEFLTPLVGSGRKRSGIPDATMLIAGVSAQKIRHLDILLVEPWVITVGPQSGVPLLSAMEIQVANPLCFIVQKFLIQKDRSPAKQAQDVLYIYDTITLFGGSLDEFNEAWKKRIGPALGEKLSTTVITLSRDTFSNLTDVIRSAARIPQDRKLSPEQIQQTCMLAFEMIFDQ